MNMLMQLLMDFVVHLQLFMLCHAVDLLKLSSLIYCTSVQSISVLPFMYSYMHGWTKFWYKCCTTVVLDVHKSWKLDSTTVTGHCHWGS